MSGKYEIDKFYRKWAICVRIGVMGRYLPEKSDPALSYQLRWQAVHRISTKLDYRRPPDRCAPH